MATPNLNIFEDTATFDIVWQRITNDDDNAQTGPGEPPDCDADFTVERAPVPASSSEAQTPSTHVIPMIATFYWISSSAKFDCSYDPTTRTYDHFGLVEGSLSEDIAVALAHANEFNNEPALDELDEGKWKLEMYTMYQGFKPSYVELWFKRRVDGVVAKATDEDLREWGLGPYGSLEEEEDEEAEEAEEEQGEQEGEQEGEEEEEEEVQLFDA